MFAAVWSPKVESGGCFLPVYIFVIVAEVRRDHPQRGCPEAVLMAAVASRPPNQYRGITVGEIWLWVY